MRSHGEAPASCLIVEYRGSFLKEGKLMEGMTNAQRKLLEYILKFSEENGYPPSVREMGRNFGWSSTNAGSDHMRRLAKKGYIQVTPGIARGIKVTPKAVEYLRFIAELDSYSK
jgi:SOS-response transcriptional repressor LexA